MYLGIPNKVAGLVLRQGKVCCGRHQSMVTIGGGDRPGRLLQLALELSRTPLDNAG